MFWPGVLIGMGIVILLKNETFQKAVMKTGMKAYRAAESGIEEVKEKFSKIESELEKEEKPAK